jgi:hypothetical protein
MSAFAASFLGSRHSLLRALRPCAAKEGPPGAQAGANRSPTETSVISGSIGRSGFALLYSIRRQDSQVELWIGHGSGQTAKNKAAFKALEAQKPAIEKDFGGSLDWQELPEAEGCRIRHVIQGGYRSPTDDWPTIQPPIRLPDIRGRARGLAVSR